MMFEVKNRVVVEGERGAGGRRIAAAALAALVGAATGGMALAHSPSDGYFSTVLRFDPDTNPPDHAGQNFGSSLNNHGQVLGQFGSENNGLGQGFVWSPGSGMQLLSDVFDVGFTPFGSQITDSGEIVGSYVLPDAPIGEFFAFRGNLDGSFTTLPGLPAHPDGASGASAISGDGTVVGSAASAPPGMFGSPGHAVFWSGDRAFSLGTLGGDRSGAAGVNSSGVIVGNSEEFPFGPNRAFRWEAGEGMQQLERPAWAIVSTAVGISDSGHIAGQVGSADATAAAIWAPDGSISVMPWHFDGDLQVAEVFGMNQQNMIVGQEIDWNAGVLHAMLWEPDGSSYTLTDLALDLPAGIQLNRAVDINENGQILANGFDSVNFEFVTVVLTPVPAPSTAMLFGGAALLIGRRRR